METLRNEPIRRNNFVSRSAIRIADRTVIFMRLPLCIAILLMNFADALLTLEFLDRGGTEANPFMAALLADERLFLGVKLGVVPTLVIATYVWAPVRGIHVIFWAYLAVCFWHVAGLTVF